ncbi:helix-turn-helix domain-containing protein [Colwellia sp. 1_MG-2023]|uniref:helix-turn-helix domain-containing protein n=1 Tax=Colwellia sp. 1_MG-2023 TaxID=3062649 RepID=UPI0026E22FB5|nr:helix-turn-helix domain-containing protein [Colwellia sp. 1_MG-2023]MDO6446768.1 helix-turn-helix domain-containing protein [Colwellia sp. 1_MG-2023]
MDRLLFNTFDLALLITIYQCILFALFLITLKKGKRQSNILLALFLLSYAAIPLDTLINFGEAFRQFAMDFSPNVFYIFGMAYWIEAVLLLFFVRSLIYKNFSLKPTDILYFLPFLIFAVHDIHDWHLLDSQTKLLILEGYQLANEPAYTRYINLFRECFRTFCGVLCLIELHRYQTHIKNEFADIEAIDLTWLKILVIGFLVIRVQAIIITLGFMTSIDLHINIDYALIGQTSNFMVMFLISFLMFYSLGFSSVFKGIENKEKIIEKDPIDLAQVEKIESFMQAQKPYLNHLLNLENLSMQLQMPARNLSQIINRHFKQNFFEFINRYRIEESKHLLQQEENRKVTMLDIMDQAGFNSKATFNTFFKKSVGLTPTQYRKEQLGSKETHQK